MERCSEQKMSVDGQILTRQGVLGLIILFLVSAFPCRQSVNRQECRQSTSLQRVGKSRARGATEFLLGFTAVLTNHRRLLFSFHRGIEACPGKRGAIKACLLSALLRCLLLLSS